MRWIQKTCKKAQHKHYLVFTFLINGKLHPLTIVPHGGQSGVGFPKGVQLENNIIDTELDSVHPERVAKRWSKKLTQIQQEHSAASKEKAPPAPSKKKKKKCL